MGLFVRTLNAAGLQTMDIVFLRAVVTAVVMVVYLFLFNRKLLVIHLKDIWCFLGTGIASITFFNYCYFKCIEEASLSIAAVLLYTAPAIVMVLSYVLFREKLTGKKIISLIMTIGGCILVTGVFEETQIINANGILLGLGAGLGYALYSIFSRYALERGYHSLTITCYTFYRCFAFNGVFDRWKNGCFRCIFKRRDVPVLIGFRHCLYGCAILIIYAGIGLHG